MKISVNENKMPLGATIIDRKKVDRIGSKFIYIVLCFVRKNYPATDDREFVTWVYNSETGGYSSGNYFDNILDAAKDYTSRA